MRAGRRRRVPTVLQSTRYDCGPACLSAVLAAFGRRVPLPALRASLDPGRDGISALELRDEAIAHGLDCRGRRAADIAALTRLPLPLVAHWESDHYVVVTAVASKHVEVMDPAIGRRRIPHAEYLAATNGIVLTFAATSEPGPRSGPPTTPTGGHPARSVVRSVVVPCLLADRAALARLAVTSLLLLGLGLVVPLLTARVVDAFVARGGASNGPASLALVAGGVLAAAAVLTQARGLATALLQRRIGERLTTTLFERMLRAPLQFIERRGPGELVGRVQSGDVLRDALANRLIGAVLDAAVGVVYLGVVLVAAPAAGLVTAALAVVQVAALGVLGRRGRVLRREELVAQAKYGSWVYEAASTIAWVKGSGAEDVIGARAARLRGRQLDALHRAGRNDALAQAVASAVRTAGPLVLLVAVTATAAGASVGRAVALATLAAAAAVPLGNIAVNLRELYEIGSVLDHLQDLVNAPAESAGSEVPAGPEGGRRIDRLDGTVTATDLCFRFTHRDPWVVERMSFHVPRGAKLAIVGPSGSGKSTLAKLLVGLYPPTSGTVAVDGHDLRTLDLPAVRRLIGVVWQEPQLFSGTIWENVSLRVPGAAPAEVQEAVRLAAIDEEIAAMPLGYATGLGPSGEGLSGGQRQRLGLARALVGRPALLVLDEATSHLDAPAEARVEQNLRSAGVTRIVIAHRLSTVQDADLILVVVGGRIVERGTHEELLARGEVYPAMVRAQQSGPGIGSVRLDRGPGSPGERSNGYALELR